MTRAFPSDKFIEEQEMERIRLQVEEEIRKMKKLQKKLERKRKKE